MSLSDIMSTMHLTIYPEVALVIFLAIFSLVVLYTWRGSHGGSWEQEQRIPLENDEVSR